MADLSDSSSGRNSLSVREATNTDYAVISSLISDEYYIHRHLDWRSPLDWLGHQPFLIAECDGKIAGSLSMPPDPDGIYWIRLFAVAIGFRRNAVFQALLNKSLEQISSVDCIKIPALSFQNWFTTLLLDAGFMSYQDIVVLEWTRTLPKFYPSYPGLTLRKMEVKDMSDVLALDNQAFEPIWRLSRDALEMAFQQSNYATICCLEDEVIGYQLSTGTFSSTHLARLAVDPGYQRHHVAKFILYDLQLNVSHTHASRLTVNTQSTNDASLALYESMGFEHTSESFPVYQLNI